MLYRLLTAISLLLPQFSFAQEVSQPDKSITLLGAIFGNLGSWSSTDNPLSTGISTLNGVILVVVGILVTYTIVVAVLNTAQDGEFMGKKMSSAWIPIRVALGTALLLPMFGSGYCMIQVLVAWFISQGVGFANSAWNGYILTRGNTIVSNIGLTNPNIKSFAYNSYKSYLCLEGSQKTTAVQPAPANMLGLPTNPSGVLTLKPGMKKIETQESTIYEFGFNDDIGAKNDSCGVIEIPKPQIIDKNVDKAFSMLPKDDYLRALEQTQNVSQTNLEATNNLLNSLQGLAKNAINKNKATSLSEIDGLISTYQETVKKVAMNEIQKNEKLLISKTSTYDGWMLAGGYYSRISLIQEMIDRSIQNIGYSTGPNFIDNKMYNEKNLYTQALIQETFNGIEDYKFKNGSKISSDKLIQKSIFGSSFSNVWTPNENEHILVSIKRLGNWLTSLGSTAFSEGMNLMIFVNNQGLTGAIQTSLYLFAFPILIIGGILSHILPFVPLIIWFGAIVGWTILCFQAIIIAPLWGVMHIIPEGHDAVGGGGQGYKIVLSLTLRPIIMIMSLLAAFSILGLIGKAVNGFIHHALLLAQTNTNVFMGLTGLIFIPLLYTIIMFVIIKKIFSIIYLVPDAILGWFGNNAQNGNFININQSSSSGNSNNSSSPITNIANSLSNSILDSGKAFFGKGNNREIDSTLKRDSSSVDTSSKVRENPIAKEFGSHGFNFVNYASSNGSNKMNSVAATTALRSQVQALGGKDSLGSIRFLRKLNAAIEEEMQKMQGQQTGWKEVFEIVSKKSLDREFGDATSEVLGRVGGGGFDNNGKAKQSFIGETFTKGALFYKNKFAKLKELGWSEDDIKAALRLANTNILYKYANSSHSIKNGGSKTIEDFMVEELDKVGI